MKPNHANNVEAGQSSPAEAEKSSVSPPPSLPTTVVPGSAEEGSPALSQRKRKGGQANKGKATSNDGMLAFHPFADIFPLLNDVDQKDLIADIRAHGLLNPITLLEFQILDGRNRYLACRSLGMANKDIPMRQFDGNGSPLLFVISQNIKRRHLTEGQRAICALQAEKLFAVKAEKRKRVLSGRRANPDGTKPKKVPDYGPEPDLRGEARDQAGKAFYVSGRSVSRAKAVAKADPVLPDPILQRPFEGLQCARCYSGYSGSRGAGMAPMIDVGQIVACGNINDPTHYLHDRLAPIKRVPVL
jgi:hypothetical protein